MKMSENMVQITCKTCAKKFNTRKSHEFRRKFCSHECRKLEKEVKKMKAVAKKVDEVKLSPAMSANIRGEIASYVKDQINLAHTVVLGHTEWNPTQARVFGMLLNKVVPDLNANFVQHEVNMKQLTDLSREELERIAQGVSEIEVQGEVIEDNK